MLRPNLRITPIQLACADPASFVGGGPDLITFSLVDEGIEDRDTPINGSSSARQQNTNLIAFC